MKTSPLTAEEIQYIQEVNSEVVHPVESACVFIESLIWPVTNNSRGSRFINLTGCQYANSLCHIEIHPYYLVNGELPWELRSHTNRIQLKRRREGHMKQNGEGAEVQIKRVGQMCLRRSANFTFKHRTHLLIFSPSHLSTSQISC